MTPTEKGDEPGTQARTHRVGSRPSSVGRSGRTGEGWQAEKSALTRQAILEAAVRCFVEHGYANTTTAMIADEASVSRGAMMHHFPSRSAVMNAVVGYLHVRRLHEYRELMTDIDSPDETLTRDAIRMSVENAWKYVNLPSFVAYQELLGPRGLMRHWPRLWERSSAILSASS